MTIGDAASASAPNVDPDLVPPSIVWRDSVPESETFDDVYYSRDGGDAETEHVFLRGNDLPDRWRGRERFVIAETGFGSGANFVVTLRRWREDPQRPRVLHFLSIEGHPWSREDLARAHASRPAEDRRWIEKLPARAPGVHRVILEEGAVILTLFYGEIATQVDRMLLPPGTAVDAWFLDGFAPSRNPAMWSPEVLGGIARASEIGSTFATYTSAGAVRRGLAAVGFDVEKRPGYGSKREMAIGVLRSEPPSIASRPAWLEPARPLCSRGANAHAVVLGAGLAGSAAARALADAGLTVEMVDRHAGPAGGASGNPTGMIHPDLALENTPRERFFAGANGFTLTRLRDAGLEATSAGPGAGRCGALYPAVNDSTRERHLKLRKSRSPLPEFARWLTADEATAHAGLEIEDDALFYPEAGWVQPRALCRANLEHQNITCRFGTEVAALERETGGWSLVDDDGSRVAHAPILVIASAAEATQLGPLVGLPLQTVRGQITQLPRTAASEALRSVVYYGGYAIPASGDTHTIGATFERNDDSTDVRAEDHRTNLERISTGFPALGRALGLPLDPARLDGRASYRTVTVDHLPLVGPVPDGPEFRERFRNLRFGRAVDSNLSMPWLEGLYLSVGHGSRGIITSQLAGEWIAGAIVGDPLPVGRDAFELLAPSRFWARAMVRRDDAAYPGG